MKVPSNLAKSSLLALMIFWTIGLTDGADFFDIASFIIISYVPIFLSCSLVILLTICPFYWYGETEHRTKRQVFQLFFPYYAIVCFGVCVYGIFNNIHEEFLIGFFVAVFITTTQSWLWFAKESKR